MKLMRMRSMMMMDKLYASGYFYSLGLLHLPLQSLLSCNEHSRILHCSIFREHRMLVVLKVFVFYIYIKIRTNFYTLNHLD